jgi:hypothetical protein
MQQQQGLESGSQEPSILGQFWQPGAISQLARVGAFRPQAYRESSSAECSDKTESLSENEDSGPRLFGESRFSWDFASFPDPAWIIDLI